MPLEQIFPVVFPIFFVVMWVAVTSLLSALSGWRTLQNRFPDRDDQVLARFHMVSGTMGGGVNYGSCLTLTACQTGLRVAVWRIFGPFDRPFFVPWEQINVERTGAFLFKRATLNFGSPSSGRLRISGRLADRLSQASEGRWPRGAPAPVTAPIVS